MALVGDNRVTRYRLNIDGMSCDHCVNSVSAALQAVSAVRDVVVDLAAGTATVGMDESGTGVTALVEAVRGAGFQVGGFSRIGDSSADS